MAVGVKERSTSVGELDWQGFVSTYFPRSRRHDLKAIVAYAAYKRSGGVEVPSSEGAHLGADAESAQAASVAEWEDEGGALQ